MIQLTVASRRTRSLADFDPEVARLVDAEDERQRQGLQLIASENLVSAAVREAVGSVFTDKYAEGRPGKRYYSGCQFSDEVEELAEHRARKLYDTDYHVNVQPHSGTQANLAVYLATLKPGDRILAMDLAMGGHLSHGSPYNASGKLYEPHFYGVSREDEQIDYDEVARLAHEVKPKLIVSGASAYPRFIDFERFASIAKDVGALLHTDMAHIAGLIAAGEHPTPFGHADFVTTTTHKTLRGPRGGLLFCKQEHMRKANSAVFPGMQGGPLMHQIAGKAVAFREAMTPEFKEYQQTVCKNAAVLADGLQKRGFRIVGGGTDNHMVLVDMAGKMTGAEAEEMLRANHIYVNKNLIPFDPLPASKTSGIRIGTPAMTSRGLGPEDFVEVAEIMADVMLGETTEGVARVEAICAQLTAG
jgi:glycine hydroxymethyltransferase